MFEWLCILCLFSVVLHPQTNPPTRPCPNPSHLPCRAPRTTRRTSGCGSQVFLPEQFFPPSWCLALRIDPIIFLFFSQSPKSDPKGRNFIQNIFWLTLSTFPTVNYGKSCPGDSPPLRLQEVYKILLSAVRNFSIQPPAAQHQKSKKSKRHKK